MICVVQADGMPQDFDQSSYATDQAGGAPADDGFGKTQETYFFLFLFNCEWCNRSCKLSRECRCCYFNISVLVVIGGKNYIYYNNYIDLFCVFFCSFVKLLVFVALFGVDSTSAQDDVWRNPRTPSSNTNLLLKVYICVFIVPTKINFFVTDAIRTRSICSRIRHSLRQQPGVARTMD